MMINKKPQKTRVGFFEVEDWEKEYISRRLGNKNLEISFYTQHLGDVPASKTAQYDIIALFVFSEVSGKILHLLPNLKFISTMSTGFDHIDVGACKKQGILVSNVPTYGENTVAEHTFGLILSLSRKIVDAVDQARVGNFSLEGLRGFDLAGKTLGIVGTGHIGLHVARIARGFEMNVLAYDPFPNRKAALKFGFKYVTLPNLLAKSDIITLHAPHNKKTHHLIGAKEFHQMKKGAFLINTARGALVNTQALLNSLQKGHLAGAGLDVLEEECTIREEKELLSPHFSKKCDLKTVLADHILLNMPNVVVTPHNAFNSHEALERIVETTTSNIKSYLAGKPENLVN